MNNDIKVFENDEFGKFEILKIKGKEYFPATDCAKILGYSNPNDAISRHCKLDGVVKHEGVSSHVNQYGKRIEQKIEKTFITEGNLYRLIIRSKLPKAEKFEKWVFDDVLPSIRKTGYINEKEFKNLERRIIKLESETSPNRLWQYSVGVNTTEIAFSLGTTPKKLFKFLVSTGVAYRKWDKYELHNDYVGFGYIQKSRRDYEPFYGKRIKYWTLKGVNLVTDLYTRANNESLLGISMN